MHTCLGMQHHWPDIYLQSGASMITHVPMTRHICLWLDESITCRMPITSCTSPNMSASKCFVVRNHKMGISQWASQNFSEQCVTVKWWKLGNTRQVNQNLLCCLSLDWIEQLTRDMPVIRHISGWVHLTDHTRTCEQTHWMGKSNKPDICLWSDT